MPVLTVSQTERILRIQQMLRARRVVSQQTFRDELEISPAQFKRDLDFLRDRFQLPIAYDAKLRGYVLEGKGDNPDIELPGPMYSGSEIHALLIMQDLISQLQPGLLDRDLAPLRERLKALLDNKDLPSEDVRKRIRILHMASRPVSPDIFRSISQGTLSRRRLHIRYHARTNNDFSDRDISPQRLVFYRGNWYADAWCHLRHDLRSFALDAIVASELLHETAQEVQTKLLDSHLGSGYGIFAGPASQTAVLRFDAEAARWVRAEQWHSAQAAALDASGCLTLTIPYAKEQELLMDILRYVPHVDVLSPPDLRAALKDRLQTALNRFAN